MPFKLTYGKLTLLFVFLLSAGVLSPNANAASCTTQSQMTAAQRHALANSSRTIVTNLQSGNLTALRENTLPAIAANFSGIAASVQSLEPLVQSATVTVEDLYLLDSSTNPAGPSRTDFYCGSPVVALNFTSLPPGTYALAILHATGVPKPQQISVILSKTPDSRWMLAGFSSKPMIEDGHDGLWYWASARKYAQTKMTWDAWLYYRIASNLLDPVSFLSSSNLEKLQRETDASRPDNLPGQKPLLVVANGASFTVTAIDSTSVFGALDLDVAYNPDATQAAQLRDPPAARGQVTEVMSALLELHPELQNAFHGIWVHANQGGASLFALELPMNQITSAPRSPNATVRSTTTP